MTNIVIVGAVRTAIGSFSGALAARPAFQLGADVIKVERPKEGDAGRSHPWFVGRHSGYFLQQNMGKQGLCVNLKDPRGVPLLLRALHDSEASVRIVAPDAFDLVAAYEQRFASQPGAEAVVLIVVRSRLREDH